MKLEIKMLRYSNLELTNCIGVVLDNHLDHNFQ